MFSRDKVYLLIGLCLGLLGIVSTIVWTIKVGMLLLFLLVMLLLILIVLQRRQMAKVQERTLKLLQFQQNDKTDTHSSIAVDLASKKIIGLLQAQQMSIDLLNDRLE